MKKFEFETSKGRFMLVDDNDFPKSLEKYTFIREGVALMFGINLSEITEEQASEIVDINRLVGDKLAYKDYLSFRYLYKAVDSLYSLFDSKGIHLFRNPYTSKINPLESKEAEQKTFYKPFVFKL